MSVRAAVKTGPRQFEVRQFAKPSIGPNEGLLRMERCGICGSDVESYHGHNRGGAEVIPGHEPMGIIEEVGEEAAERWGVKPGDRVAVEIIVPCRSCALCLTGQYMACRSKPAMYSGSTPVSRKPSLWGGYAEYLYLHPNTILHKIRPDIAPDIAVMFNPLGAGVRWVYQLGGVGLGDSVLILGPGQRGLASVIAAKTVGAGTIIVTGLERDHYKLALAKQLGADFTINVDKENTVERVREITNGTGVDVALDVAPIATRPTIDAIESTRHGGTVVLAGLKGQNTFPFNNSMLISKGLTMIGAYSVDAGAYAEAIKIIESGEFPLEKLHTHTFGLGEAGRAIEVLAGEVQSEEAIHVTIDPFA